MSAEYDHIAGDYQLSKRLPFRECIEWYSYRHLPGSGGGLEAIGSQLEKRWLPPPDWWW
jgi:hypothetical protein